MCSLVRNPSLVLTACLLGAAALAAQPARATVIAAERSWPFTTAELQGKGYGTHHIYQLHNGEWVDTGFTVTVGESGHGWNWWWNRAETAETLKNDRPTRTGTNGPDMDQEPLMAGPAAVAIAGGSLVPGQNSVQQVRLFNSSIDSQGHVFVASRNPGTIMSLRLNPAQAQFIPGPIAISCPGVNFQTMNVSPTDITFRIISNANPAAPSPIMLTGVRIAAVGPPGSPVDLLLDGQGSSTAYLDGQPVGQVSFAFGQFLSTIQTLWVTGGNDNCVSATSIGDGVLPFATIGATTDGPPDCGYILNDVWFLYTAGATGTLAANLCGSGFDTVLAAYPLGCPAQGGLACNDDTCALQSSITFPVTAGMSYLLRIGGYGGDTGTGVLNVFATRNVGRCCLPSGNCIVTDQGDCEMNRGGTYGGDGTVCPDGGRCDSPACAADWNHDGILNSQDFFDFLAQFFAANADFNHDSITNSQDLFDYLTAFFRGCP